jgi:hypothetical protein
MSENHLKWPYSKTYFEQQLSESDVTEKKYQILHSNACYACQK